MRLRTLQTLLLAPERRDAGTISAAEAERFDEFGVNKLGFGRNPVLGTSNLATAPWGVS
jgi:hypothetical protein